MRSALNEDQDCAVPVVVTILTMDACESQDHQPSATSLEQWNTNLSETLSRCNTCPLLRDRWRIHAS